MMTMAMGSIMVMVMVMVVFATAAPVPPPQRSIAEIFAGVAGRMMIEGDPVIVSKGALSLSKGGKTAHVQLPRPLAEATAKCASNGRCIEDESLNATWPLLESEAVVVIGPSPPHRMSFRLNLRLESRYYPKGWQPKNNDLEENTWPYLCAFGEQGYCRHRARVAHYAGATPYKESAFVICSDKRMYETIKTNVPFASMDSVYWIPVPQDMAARDIFSADMEVMRPKKPSVFTRYMRDNSLSVFRISRMHTSSAAYYSSRAASENEKGNQ
eukprot:g191.t1